MQNQRFVESLPSFEQGGQWNTEELAQVLQRTLQRGAARCNTAQLVATLRSSLQHCLARCNTAQLVATLCSSLQHCAAHCNTVQLPDAAACMLCCALKAQPTCIALFYFGTK